MPAYIHIYMHTYIYIYIHTHTYTSPRRRKKSGLLHNHPIVYIHIYIYTWIYADGLGRLLNIDLSGDIMESFEDRAWNSVSTEGESIPKRMYHAMTAMETNLYIYGGLLHGEGVIMPVCVYVCVYVCV